MQGKERVCRKGDHPRTRGEKYTRTNPAWVLGGSPPRVRGKGPSGPDHHSRRGITPARAGKSPPLLQTHSNRGDHPRACGEKLFEPAGAGGKGGSPPRVRGKGFPLKVFRGYSGITPARAGKSSPPPATSWPTWDHPRACGEKYNSVHISKRLLGSPPRVRGKAALRPAHPLVDRITPARAGKRRDSAIQRRWMRDHPRACGEKQAALECGPEVSGSPPRVRGKAVEVAPSDHPAGITPARAGKR